MYYLIDGYNALFYLLESKKSLQSQRGEVIRSLQKEFAALHLKGTIVFDGAHLHDEQSGLSYHSPLVIAYSHRGQTADAYILEQLEIADVPSEIILITNDRSLSAAGRELGAGTLSLKAFLSFLERKRTMQHKLREVRQEKASRPHSKNDQERFIRLFEERLKKPI